MPQFITAAKEWGWVATTLIGICVWVWSASSQATTYELMQQTLDQRTARVENKIEDFGFELQRSRIDRLESTTSTLLSQQQGVVSRLDRQDEKLTSVVSSLAEIKDAVRSPR